MTGQTMDQTCNSILYGYYLEPVYIVHDILCETESQNWMYFVSGPLWGSEHFYTEHILLFNTKL